MLGAGLKGIQDGYKLAKPVEDNIFHMSERDMKKHGISSLPGSLHEAVLNLEKSTLMREVLGDHLHNALVEYKYDEWDRYRMQITEYEIEKYLPVL